MSDKALVILTGWLGCQPHNLRRYEALYRRHGMQVLSYIAPPTAVFECTLPYYTTDNYRRTSSESSRKYEMQQLVDRMVADLQASNCSSYFFHCFSNGGCFVWEAFRQVTPIPPSGVLMDSCPGFQIHRLTMALDYCTWKERLQVAWRYGYDFYRAHNHSAWQPHVQTRANQYLHNLRDDHWRIPQLFLYSRDDPLMPFSEVAALAQARRDQGVAVTEKVWEHSRHCAHYIDHAEEYEQAIESFLRQTRAVASESLRAKL